MATSGSSRFRRAAKRAFTLLSAPRTHAKDYRCNPPTFRIIRPFSALDRVRSTILSNPGAVEAMTRGSTDRPCATHHKPSGSRPAQL